MCFSDWVVGGGILLPTSRIRTILGHVASGGDGGIGRGNKKDSINILA